MTARPKLKRLKRQSIVVTAATSPLGEATVWRAARTGARVFMIAADEAGLRRLCEEVQQDGHRCAWAVSDGSDIDDLIAATEKCQRLFGGFDSWINLADGGDIDTLPALDAGMAPDDPRRWLDADYWRLVNGATVAMEVLAVRPGGGMIVNVCHSLDVDDLSQSQEGSQSQAGLQDDLAAPNGFARREVKAFTHQMRHDLAGRRAPVGVALVKPTMIQTSDHEVARRMRHPQPVYAPEVVADTILWCASHGTQEITVGGGGRLIASFYAAFPELAEPLLSWFAPVVTRDTDPAYRPYDEGIDDLDDDGLDQEVRYPMVRNFSVAAEVRKHPGITAGSVALVLVAAAATVLLTQRTGPMRYQIMRQRMDPRTWIDAEALRHRFDDISRGLRDGVEGLGEKAEDVGDDTRYQAGRWFRKGRRVLSPARRDRYGRQAKAYADTAGKTARRYADDAGQYAKDHAREGGAVLAVATIAALIGAAALETRRSDSKIRELLDF